MSDPQIKELFGAMVVGAPADRLDVDLAITVGRRRRRVRVTAALASVAIVVAVMTAFAFGLPRTTSTPLPIGPTLTPTATADPSPTPSVASVVSGSASDWADAVTESIPYRDELVQLGAFVSQDDPTGGTSGDVLGRSSMVQAVYSYTHAGRSTGLVVFGRTKGTYGPYRGEARDILRKQCPAQAPCELRDTPAGPVVITSSTLDMNYEGGTGGTAELLSASHLSDSGILLTVTSFNAPVDSAGNPERGKGSPGMADDLDRLVATVIGVPTPGLEKQYVVPTDTWSPTPVASAGADSAVVVKTSGKPFDIGSGASITATADTVCAAVGGASTCAPVGRGGERDVSKAVVPLPGGGFVVVGKHGLSDAEIGSIVVTMGRTSRVATLVKLSKDDPHVSYFVVMPAASSAAATVEVFDHSGRLIAQNPAG